MDKTSYQEVPFNTALDKISSGVLRLVISKVPKVIFANSALCEMLDYKRSEMLALEPAEIFASSRTLKTLINSTRKNKTADKGKIFLKTKDGDKCEVSLHSVWVKGSRGKKPCIDFIVETVNVNKRIQKDIADSKELFKTVFNNSAVGIIVTDNEQHIVAWNPFTESLLGMGWEDLFNRPLKDLFPEEKWGDFKSFNSQKKELLPEVETSIITKSGKLSDISLSLSLVRNPDGEVIGSIGIMHDISLQKKTQKMLINAKKIAETASEAKTMFLANMSHEVRTPMNTILGMVDLTLDTELTEEQRDNLLTVKNAADILLSLLNDILDLSRVEAGKIQLENIEIKVERIVSSVCKTMEVLAKNKSLSLRWLVDEEVPDMVKGDPVRIRQVLVNLINNAIKFTSEGKIQVEVKLKNRKGDHCQLLFSVADEGIGIDNDKLESIFEVFTQEDVSTTRQFGGTGLGLAICKKLLELMGGSIWVESDKGKGSTFYFVVPCDVVKREEVPEALQGESIEAQLMAQISKKKSEEQKTAKTDLHILLAEDNPVNQKMAQRMLEKKGWTVTAVNNGQEVLDLMEKQTFDLILMDAQMPVLDGFESTREIRKREESSGKRIPIVALTARVMAGDRKKCLDCGMDGYVSKPIERQQLFETVQSFFN